VVPKVKTSGARLRKKLKRVNAWARARPNRHRLPELWETFCAKLRGHLLDSGVSYNQVAGRTVVLQATRHLFTWLNRRSQRKSFSWERFERFVQSHPLPAVRVHHSLVPSQ
jgi:RNA-directed DNA polymerase